MLEMVSVQYTRVLVLGGVWCLRWSQANTPVFWCLLESSVGDGLSPTHPCFGVCWNLVLEMVSVQYTHFWCLVESGVGDGLNPIHSCFGVW